MVLVVYDVALLLGVVLAICGQAALGVPRWRGLCGLLVALMTALGRLYGDAAGRGLGAEPPLRELFLLEQAALVLPLTAGAVWLTDRLLGRAR